MRTLSGLFTTCVLLLTVPSAWAQDRSGAGAGAASPSDTSGSQGDQGEGGPTVSNSTVGYIDNAIPGNVVRFRYDSAYNNNSPSRGEFFYARTGRGLPLE